MDYHFADCIGPFGLWNAEAEEVETTFGPSFAICTPKGPSHSIKGYEGCSVISIKCLKLG
jgi:hypothetical protein